MISDDQPAFSTSPRNRLARSYGFDRRGPHAQGETPARGMSCRCEWAAERHGEYCPEHGYRGTVIPDELEVVRAERDELRKMLAKAKTKTKTKGGRL